MKICMISDFFYPNLGGVENHIYQLSCYLQRLGHKVLVLTHQYKNRQGIRYMGNGIKVYYLPFKPLSVNIIFPTAGFATLKKIREIIISENIDIFHGHQATSPLVQELIYICGLLNKPIVITDHSLFAFNDFACVNINKVISTIYRDVDHNIAVSYIGKENMMYRSDLDLNRISITPNCIDFSKFKNEIGLELDDKVKNIIYDVNDLEIENINIDNSIDKMDFYVNYKSFTLVSISRQTYRKGTDLLIEVIPLICRIFPNIKIIIGGDGDKKYLIDKMVDHFKLRDKIEVLGSLQHYQVMNTLKKGDIYLNTSLTEAFCIAILEAASSGLFVVSTDIGGVAEVLPRHMRILVDSNLQSIINGINHALKNIDKIKKFTPYNHLMLKDKYNWYYTTKITENIYENCVKVEHNFVKRFERLFSKNGISIIYYFLIILVQLFLLFILRLIQPENSIKKEKEFDYNKYKKYVHSLSKTNNPD